MGWLTGWSKRQPITLTGGSDGAQTDFQLLLSIAYDSDMLSDFSDLRFTKEDGETLIDAWLEDKTDGTSADVCVEFPSTPANGETQTYYMYYGKSDALDYWDIGEAFLFGDDFSGDLSKWSVADFSIVDSELNTNNVANAYAYPNFSLTTSHIVEYDCKLTSAADGHTVSGFGTDPPFDAVGEIFFRSDGTNINLYENNDTIFAIGDWIKITFNLGTSKIYADDVYKTTTTLTGDHVQFGMMRDDKHTGYYDNFRVRKYTANPPTYEFGSEQSESGGLSMAVVMHHLRQQGIS